MKKILLIGFFFSSFNISFSQVRPIITIEVLKSGISLCQDSISFVITSSSRDTLIYQVSIEVFYKNQWLEVYSDILNLDRDLPLKDKLMPVSKARKSFSKNAIHQDYQEIYQNCKFRLVLNTYSLNQLYLKYRKKSNSFTLRW